RDAIATGLRRADPERDAESGLDVSHAKAAAISRPSDEPVAMNQLRLLHRMCENWTSDIPEAGWHHCAAVCCMATACHRPSRRSKTRVDLILPLDGMPRNVAALSAIPLRTAPWPYIRSARLSYFTRVT